MKLPKKLPTSVIVGGKRFAIKHRSRIIDDGQECWGLCHSEAGVIYVKTTDLSPDHQWETLLHECIHAIEDENNLNLSERAVDALSRGVYALLKDNIK